MTVSRSVGAVAREIAHPSRARLSDGTALGRHAAARRLADHLPRRRRTLRSIARFGSRWMISAVARIMQPGAKVDHMLILEGPQGGRSRARSRCSPVLSWFTDELAEIGSKDAAQQMRGIWIIEIAELDAISRAEVSRIKAFLTRTTDRYRPPYERYVVEVPRQCVFAGSVNPDTYLRDETGNRRFWPVRCGTHRSRRASRDRDQLWAEAVVRYRDGAIWWLDEPELIADAKTEQDQRYQADAWDARIDRWLVYERRRVNHGYGNYDDWRDEEVERPEPADRCFGRRNPRRGAWYRARAMDESGSDASGRVSKDEWLGAVSMPIGRLPRVAISENVPELRMSTDVCIAAHASVSIGSV